MPRYHCSEVVHLAAATAVRWLPSQWHANATADSMPQPSRCRGSGNVDPATATTPTDASVAAAPPDASVAAAPPDAASIGAARGGKRLVKACDSSAAEHIKVEYGHPSGTVVRGAHLACVREYRAPEDGRRAAPTEACLLSLASSVIVGAGAHPPRFPRA